MSFRCLSIRIRDVSDVSDVSDKRVYSCVDKFMPLSRYIKSIHIDAFIMYIFVWLYINIFIQVNLYLIYSIAM